MGHLSRPGHNVLQSGEVDELFVGWWAIENVIKLGPNHNLKGIPPKEMARILVCNSVRAIG